MQFKQLLLVLCSDAEPVDLDRFADHLAGSYIPNTVIIDATASEVPPSHYLAWMQKGIHIITPNKKLGSGPLDQYLALRSFQRESYIHFFYEVGSCLSSLLLPCLSFRLSVCISAFVLA